MMVFLTFMIFGLQVDSLEKQLHEQQEEVSSSPVVFSCSCLLKAKVL